MLPVKICGKIHSHCKVCRPEVGQVLSATRKKPGFRPPFNPNPYAPTRFGGSEFKHKIKICGKEHAWCSVCRPEINPPRMLGKKHTLEARVKMRQAQLKVEHTPEWNAAVSRGVIRHRESGCSNACCSPARSPTSLEYALQLLLEDADLEFETQIRFGRYAVDAWIPSHRLVFEADGSYWHQRDGEGRRVKRDAFLLSKGAKAVIHLTEHDLDPWLEA